MFKKILKWIGYTLLTIVILVAAFYVKARWSTGRRLHEKYDITLQPFTLKTDSAIVAEGHRIMLTKGCRNCHGDDLAGKVWLDDPMLGKVVTPNLTKGKGGRPQDYDTKDWLLALQHGVRRDLTPLMIMPGVKHVVAIHLGKTS